MIIRERFAKSRAVREAARGVVKTSLCAVRERRYQMQVKARCQPRGKRGVPTQRAMRRWQNARGESIRPVRWTPNRQCVWGEESPPVGWGGTA